MDDKLREAIAAQIIVDSNCSIDSDFPCPHDEPIPGYKKCKQGKAGGTCMWQREQAENIIAVIRAHGWRPPANKEEVEQKIKETFQDFQKWLLER